MNVASNESLSSGIEDSRHVRSPLVHRDRQAANWRRRGSGSAPSTTSISQTAEQKIVAAVRCDLVTAPHRQWLVSALGRAGVGRFQNVGWRAGCRRQLLEVDLQLPMATAASTLPSFQSSLNSSVPTGSPGGDGKCSSALRLPGLQLGHDRHVANIADGSGSRHRSSAATGVGDGLPWPRNGTWARSLSRYERSDACGGQCGYGAGACRPKMPTPTTPTSAIPSITAPMRAEPPPRTRVISGSGSVIQEVSSRDQDPSRDERSRPRTQRPPGPRRDG